MWIAPNSTPTSTIATHGGSLRTNAVWSGPR
jgi:hypothetical protein